MSEIESVKQYLKDQIEAMKELKDNSLAVTVIDAHERTLDFIKHIQGEK